MDIQHNIGYRHNDVKYAVRNGENKYDYENEGILNKCLPKILFKGNPIFVTYLQMIDQRIIMLLKYIDRIKNFKNIGLYY